MTYGTRDETVLPAISDIMHAAPDYLGALARVWPTVQSKRQARHELIKTMARQGSTLSQIAEAVGLRYASTHNYCVRHDIPFTHAKRGPKSAFEPKPWHIEAVSLRERGLTYQAIAERFGVTRERVRQVLSRKMGRADLCHRPALKERSLCENCGGPRPLGNHRFCGRRCEKAYTNRTPAPFHLRVIEVVFRRRVHESPPVSWVDIGYELGLNSRDARGSSTPGHFRVACKRAGIDPSPAFGLYTKRRSA